MKTKKLVTFLTLLFVAMHTILSTSVVDTEAATEAETEAKKAYTCTFNGTERTLIPSGDNLRYKIDNKTIPLWYSGPFLDAGIDRYGTVLLISNATTDIYWWNYDILYHLDYPDIFFYPIPQNNNLHDTTNYVTNVKSLIYDSEGYVIGYKTDSGEGSILNLDQMKEYASNWFRDPAPSPTPATTPTPGPTVPTDPATTVPQTQNPTGTATSGEQTTTETDTAQKKLKTMKLSSIKAKKNTKKIAGKVSVSKATVKIKVGKKAYKKATVKGRKFTLKVAKLKKKTKITIQVTKKGYRTVKKTVRVK